MTTQPPALGRHASASAAPRPASPDILCRDLVRIFVTEGIEVQALQGLNLRVEAGEIVALVGASGSGKSTLLSILSGLDRPTGGTAEVAGADLLTLGRRDRVRYQRQTVGFVWQQAARNLLPYLTAAQNVALPLTITRAPDRRGGLSSCSTCSASRTARTACPPRCREVSSSVSRSPSPWPTRRGCCWPTSPRASSTRRPRPRSSRCSARSTRRRA